MSQEQIRRYAPFLSGYVNNMLMEMLNKDELNTKRAASGNPIKTRGSY